MQNNAEKLDALLEQLLDREMYYGEKRRASAEAEYEHKMKRAIEYRLAEGSIEARKMRADELCKDEMKTRFDAEAESDIAFQKLLDVRIAVSARQSILNAETKRNI